MHLSFYTMVATGEWDVQDASLADEELAAYLEDFYHPKTLKKDRLKRFRND